MVPTTLPIRRSIHSYFGVAAVFSLMLLTSGCADAPASSRGAGVGAALGSGIALATGAGVAGTIGGALIGGAVGYAGGWAAGGN